MAGAMVVPSAPRMKSMMLPDSWPMAHVRIQAGRGAGARFRFFLG